MRTFFSAAAALLAGFVLAFAPTADARVVGSGRSATETRSVSDFESIAASGSIDIVVRQAAKEAVQIEADDNVLPLVETTVENTSQGRTLVVRLKRGENIRHGKPIRAIVDVVRLSSISCAGSGDVTIGALKTPALKLSIAGSSDARIAGLDTESFELRISGSGDVSAAGSARQVKVSIAGSGDADLAALAADDVTVKIAGSGDASVTANKSLEVSVAGSGDVRYAGNPSQLKLSAAGSGTITRR
jgi:hypothetical protein